MLKGLMISTAAAALLVGAAIAQQTPPVSQPTTPQAQASRQFITQQQSDQWLFSKFNGTDVIGTNNERIGDVNDLLFDRNGKVMAYVIGVGGFLGIGTKDVALAPAAFQMHMDGNELKLRLAMTRDELKNAPEFKAMETRPAPTTGQSPPPASPPAKAPAR